MPKSGTAVELDRAHEPFVLALDVGSTASRGGLYDAAGRPVHGVRHKIPHRFTSAADGTSEIDPDLVVNEISQLITAVTSCRPGVRVAGVALDTFASSLIGVDAAGTALTPCYTYADSRCAPQLAQLRAELDEGAVHDRTGARLHTSYLPARVRWLRESAADVFARVTRWLSIGEYVHLRLLGDTAIGTSTAAWTGMLDRRTGRWDQPMLDAAGIDPGQLSEIREPGWSLHDDGRAARRWPGVAGSAWFPVVADGFASNVGAGAADESTIAAAAATSGAMRVLVSGNPEAVPAGLWCYRVDASRSLVGGALSDVGRLVTWLQETLAVDRPGAPLDTEAVMLAAPKSDTPLVLPYLTGERSTGWVGDARAVFAGISVDTAAPQLFRGALEGVAMIYARVARELQQVAGPARRIVASGRVTNDLPAWLQVLADALGAPVEHVTMKRTTLHGTALIALETIAPDVSRAPVDTGTTYEPTAGNAPYYRTLQERSQALYDAVIAPSA
jgi:gluconokinase